MTTLETLTAISPIDGRYRGKTESLAPLVSEFGLIHARVEIEVAWFKHCANTPAFDALPALSAEAIHYLDGLVEGFDIDAAREVKTIEQTTNHDVKAVEYYLKNAFERHKTLVDYKELLHFACTSEDINNLAYALMLQRARQQHLIPMLNQLTGQLADLAKRSADIPMLARTHGQSATPTTVGKEFANVCMRLKRQKQQLDAVVISGKFNGAVGNYNAHHIAYPDIDWPTVNRDFVESLGLSFNAYTTQIEPHDMIAEFCHALMRCNQVIKDICRDMWTYISMGYFKQNMVAGEVGSSTMPHKVNPIDFENAEGNCGIANAALHFFAEQLTNSRMQRDLVDSTVLRNLGTAFAHALLAFQATAKGLGKCQLDEQRLTQDLANHWEVLSEAVQTVMRCHRVANPYEQLKALTRGKALTQAHYQAFVAGLGIDDAAKVRLMELTPEAYTGYASVLAKTLGNVND